LRAFSVFFILFCTAVINKIVFFNLEPESRSEPEKPEPNTLLSVQTSTETPNSSLRNITLTTHSDNECGGYNVWIEIEVDKKTCITKQIPEFAAGNTLLWFGKYLGSCRDFEFGKDLDMINFKVKENTTNDFCPRYLYAFMDSDVTFRSDEMTAWYEYDDTNDKNHIARRISGTFELPEAGKSFET
jgi:hypothetical protein